MRVKIGYTIEKEDIPPLLNQMSCQSLTRAEGLCKVYEKLLSSKDYGVSSLDDIKKLTENLRALLETAVDMESILTGMLVNFGPKIEEGSADEVVEKLKDIKQKQEKD